MSRGFEGQAEIVTPFGHAHNEMAAIHGLYMRVALRPEAYCTRISERISVAPWTVERNVSFSYHLPLGSFSFSRIVIPVMQVERGRAFVDFSCVDESGKVLPVLSMAETQFLAATTVHYAVKTVAEPFIDRVGDDNEREAVSAEIDRIARSFASIPLLAPGTARDRLKELLDRPAARLGDSDLVRDILRLVRDSRDVQNLLENLASYYYISVVYYVGDRHDRPIIRIRYRKTYIERLGHGRKAKWRRSLQSVFGASQGVYAFPIDLARRTNSYHLRIRGPEDNFVKEQSVRFQNLPTDEPRDVIRSRNPHAVQGRPSAPSSYVHLYVGLQGNPDDNRRLFARVQFLEVPPGSLVLAAFLAIITSSILVVTMHSLVYFVRSASVISGIPALILAIPGAASIWRYPSYSMAVGQLPLRARMTFACVAGSCLVAAISITVLSARHYWTLSPLTYGLWAILALLNLGFASWCLHGARWNRLEHRRAIAISKQREDTLTISDVAILESWKA